jgi:predicted NAD/FAD-binding protein
MVDNGQHILIGAYTESLRLMRTVGVDPESALLRLPLALRFADGTACAAQRARAAGRAGRHPARPRLALAERWPLLRAPRLAARRLCLRGDVTVATLPRPAPALMAEFVEPLCVAALNTPGDQASGPVFLRVLHDALLGGRGPTCCCRAHRPGRAAAPAAARWLQQRGAVLRRSERIDTLHAQGLHWHVGGQAFDRVIWPLQRPMRLKPSPNLPQKLQIT